MSHLKQVKVDNWGIYFLQRLKHFFNRTDYCDLTLQFQDNAQLKVHRLVLNACTEYFELLERTCEMYEDCLIMPDDLQADVVVPIINFMYTGQLEFKPELLEKLYQTAQVMNMPVLSKLLLAQPKAVKPSVQGGPKRSFTTAFPNSVPSQTKPPERKIYKPNQYKKKPIQETKLHRNKAETVILPVIASSGYQRLEKRNLNRSRHVDPRPTRYEVPEDLADNIADDSFTNISYESRPLMVHPETSKRYGAKKNNYGIFSETSISSNFNKESGTIDVVECRKIDQDLFDDNRDISEPLSSYDNIVKSKKDASNLFDQIIATNNEPKITIETKDSKEASNVDHAKIISEVLKKYPHLVKGNKNIKLKIVDAKSKTAKKPVVKKNISASSFQEVKVKTEHFEENYTYESDVIDSKEAARLISLGAENVKGPWICLICGTPGRALHFTTYHQFRRHLVDVHNEKIIPNICEYCGIKSHKRNHLLHHLYTKHGVKPPPHCNFPKCNMCNYIALTESYLLKHKATHRFNSTSFQCNVCLEKFNTRGSLLNHIHVTGHKIKLHSDKTAGLKCLYCLKEFIRENNLYNHLLTRHKESAYKDGIIESSDDEYVPEEGLKTEPNDYDSSDEMKESLDMSKVSDKMFMNSVQKQKILNVELGSTSKGSVSKLQSTINNTFEDTELMGEDIEVILPEENYANQELLINNDEFVETNQRVISEEFYDIKPTTTQIPTKSKSLATVITPRVVRKPVTSGQELQIAVSSAEEYKTLIESDHPVILDQEGNPTKTLAVLTTPQCSTINTSAQVNVSSESQEVMLIPEQYALNVSQAITTDNSNIVVVYSDDLDQTKQYILDPSYVQGQIVTSEGVTTHFVPTSAVITQNYSSSVDSQEMSAAQAGWQENEESPASQQVNIEETVETAANDDSVVISNNENLIEMTEMVTVGDGQESMETEPVESIGDENNQPEQLISEQLSAENDMDVSVVSQTKEIVEATIESAEDPNAILNEANIESNVETAEEVIESEIQEQQQETEPLNEEQASLPVIDENVVEQSETTAEVVEESPSVDIEKNAETSEVPPKAEFVKNLTSEWTEDDKEDSIEEQTETTEISDLPIGSPQEEIEESIENIQQEIENHVAEPAQSTQTKTIEPDEETAEPEDKTEPETPTENTNDNAVSVPAKTNENISSLLSDWNENDSQECTGSEENDVENGHQNEEVETAPAPAEKPEVIEPIQKKADNIKSLVSDWDEDEEDSKI